TLGTINHTLLTLYFAKKEGICVHGIIFNGFSETVVEQDNIDTIQKLSGVPVLGIIPRMEGIDVENRHFGELKSVFEQTIRIEDMVKNV
ncbi:MAG: AAA family ATPase, partial [Clostridiales bacterium]|nr:AAA family ATPase [Clostridiales bacterium]